MKNEIRYQVIVDKIRLIATRFAREARLKGCITSNDTITAFDAWFKSEDWFQNDQIIPLNTDISITLQDVINERKRAMEIARDFMNSYVQKSREKIPGSVQQIIQDELAETSRYIMNAISGRTGLNLDTSIDDLVLCDLKNKASS